MVFEKIKPVEILKDIWKVGAGLNVESSWGGHKDGTRFSQKCNVVENIPPKKIVPKNDNIITQQNVVHSYVFNKHYCGP